MIKKLLYATLFLTAGTSLLAAEEQEQGQQPRIQATITEGKTVALIAGNIGASVQATQEELVQAAQEIESFLDKIRIQKANKAVAKSAETIKKEDLKLRKLQLGYSSFNLLLHHMLATAQDPLVKHKQFINAHSPHVPAIGTVGEASQILAASLGADKTSQYFKEQKHAEINATKNLEELSLVSNHGMLSETAMNQEKGLADAIIAEITGRYPNGIMSIKGKILKDHQISFTINLAGITYAQLLSFNLGSIAHQATEEFAKLNLPYSESSAQKVRNLPFRFGKSLIKSSLALSWPKAETYLHPAKDDTKLACFDLAEFQGRKIQLPATNGIEAWSNGVSIDPVTRAVTGEFTFTGKDTTWLAYLDSNHKYPKAQDRQELIEQHKTQQEEQKKQEEIATQQNNKPLQPTALATAPASPTIAGPNGQPSALSPVKSQDTSAPKVHPAIGKRATDFLLRKF